MWNFEGLRQSAEISNTSTRRKIVTLRYMYMYYVYVLQLFQVSWHLRLDQLTSEARSAAKHVRTCMLAQAFEAAEMKSKAVKCSEPTVQKATKSPELNHRWASKLFAAYGLPEQIVTDNGSCKRVYSLHEREQCETYLLLSLPPLIKWCSRKICENLQASNEGWT